MSRVALWSSGSTRHSRIFHAPSLLRLVAASVSALVVLAAAATPAFAQTISLSANPVCVNTPVTVTVTAGSCEYGGNPSVSVGANAVILTNNNGAWSATLTMTNTGSYTLTGSNGCSSCTSTNLLVVQLNGLTIAGATSIDGTNYAAVKTPTNNYVTITASVDPNDTNAAALITWSTNVTPVSTNPLQVLVSTRTSAQTPVTASCCNAFFSNDVWVLWGSVSILTTGTNPSNAPSHPFYVPGSNLLGIQYGTMLSGDNYAYGKMCAIGNITPAGVHAIISNGWNMNLQEVMGRYFGDGVALSNQTYTNWTNDDTLTTSIPDNCDNLYLIDGPNINRFGHTNSSEVYLNFCDYFTWNGQICCDTNNFWHFQARWKADQTPQVTFTNLGGGTNNIPTNAFYPRP